MEFGTFHISLPGQSATHFEPDTASFTAGSTPSNRLQLQHPTIARRHARFTFAQNRLLIEDLGSTEGTFINGQRLTVATPTVVSPGTRIRLGQVNLVYHSLSKGNETPEAFVRPAGSTYSPASALVGQMVLELPIESLIPGNQYLGKLTVRNTGLRAGEFTLRVAGHLSHWVTLATQTIYLQSQESQQLTVQINLPQSSQVAAGRHQVQVVALNSANDVVARVETVLKVANVQKVSMELAGSESEKPTITIQNFGNAPVSYRLVGQDDGEHLHFHFAQDTVSIPAGESYSCEVGISPRESKLFGSRQTVPYSIIATPLSHTSSEVLARGSYLLQPSAPIWLPLVGIVSSLVLCLAVVLWLMNSCRANHWGFCGNFSRPEITSFSVYPDRPLQPGEQVMVSWSVSNADIVEIRPSIGQVPNHTSHQFITVQTNTELELVARNGVGEVRKSVNLAVQGAPPTIAEFKIEPSTLIVNQPKNIKLTWNVIGADIVTLEGTDFAVRPVSSIGEQLIENVNAALSFKLVARTNNNQVVEQVAQVQVLQSNCLIQNLPAGQSSLVLREGPDDAYKAIASLPNNSPVLPIGRIATGTWLRVQAGTQVAWVQAAYIKCEVNTELFPTVSAGDIPLLPVLPSQTATATWTLTATPTNLPPTNLPTTAIPTTAVPLVPTTQVPLVTETATATPTPIISATPTLATPTPIISATPTLATPIVSTVTSVPPAPLAIDGTAQPAEWQNAVSLAALPHGVVRWRNDNQFLYLLIDQVQDTQADTLLGSDLVGDDFYLIFDVNRNGVQDINQDVVYARDGKVRFLHAGNTLSVPSATQSIVVAGFGSTFSNAVAHRYWEIAIRLTEIQATVGQVVKLGLKVVSQNPAYVDEVPAAPLTNFGEFLTITLPVQP
jgi:hypothetical protein